jgi:GntP family gluconate:H+ symporter
VIILLTTKYRVHAFFALILACFVTGLGIQLPLTDVIATIKDGFGNIMKSLGLIIVTAASIVQPLLPILGFHTPAEKLLCVLSMGAGYMAISHANDAYFWVIVKFSGLDMKSVLQVYSIATLWMSLVSLLMVYLLSFVLT